MFAIWLALVFLFGVPQQSNPTPQQQAEIQAARAQAEQYRQQAIELNTDIGQIQSEADARKIVDKVANMFADELPPAWATAGIRERVARAEYRAVSDADQLVPEKRLADVWNEYVRTIGAPQEALVTPDELHWLRDSEYATGRLMWMRGYNQTIWTMPNVYAADADGKVAGGCRALEAMRVLWDLENNFQSVRFTRERMRRGVLTSDLLKKQLENPNQSDSGSGLDTGSKTRVRAVLTVVQNPVQPAENRYIQEHGMLSYYVLLNKLFNELFPD